MLPSVTATKSHMQGLEEAKIENLAHPLRSSSRAAGSLASKKSFSERIETLQSTTVDAYLPQRTHSVASSVSRTLPNIAHSPTGATSRPFVKAPSSGTLFGKKGRPKARNSMSNSQKFASPYAVPASMPWPSRAFSSGSPERLLRRKDRAQANQKSKEIHNAYMRQRSQSVKRVNSAKKVAARTLTELINPDQLQHQIDQLQAKMNTTMPAVKGNSVVTQPNPRNPGHQQHPARHSRDPARTWSPIRSKSDLDSLDVPRPIREIYAVPRHPDSAEGDSFGVDLTLPHEQHGLVLSQPATPAKHTSTTPKRPTEAKAEPSVDDSAQLLEQCGKLRKQSQLYRGIHRFDEGVVGVNIRIGPISALQRLHGGSKAFAIMIGMVELGGAAVGSIETTAEELSQLLEISITPRTVLTRAMVEQLLVDFVWCKRVWVKTPHIEPGESLGQSVSAADIQSIAGSRSGNPKVLQAVRALLSQPVVDASNGLYALPAIPNAVDAAGRRGSASVRRNRTDQPHVSFPSSFSNAFTTPWLRCKLATVQHRDLRAKRAPAFETRTKMLGVTMIVTMQCLEPHDAVLCSAFDPDFGLESLVSIYLPGSVARWVASDRPESVVDTSAVGLSSTGDDARIRRDATIAVAQAQDVGVDAAAMRRMQRKRSIEMTVILAPEDLEPLTPRKLCNISLQAAGGVASKSRIWWISDKSALVRFLSRLHVERQEVTKQNDMPWRSLYVEL